MAYIPTESLNDLREMWPTATNCGDTLYYSSEEGLRDECGHPVAMVHERWLRRAVRVMSLMDYLHRVNPEGFIPTCGGCGEPWPCAMRRALEDAR